MKKYSIFALVLVLTATLFAGCRRNNGTDATTLPMTEPSTQPATEMTMAPETEGMVGGEGMIGSEGTVLPTDAAGNEGAATDSTGNMNTATGNQ